MKSVKNAKSDKTTPVITKRMWVTAAIATGMLLVLLSVFILQSLFTKDDGTTKYTGAQQQLAKKAIGDISYLTDNKKRWAYRFYVEDVRPTTPEEINNSCTPNKGAQYLLSIQCTEALRCLDQGQH